MYFRGLVASCVLFFSGVVGAVPYTFSLAELQGFSLQYSDPASALYTGINDNGEFSVHFIPTTTGNTATARVGAGAADFSGYDSLVLQLNNSSYADLGASLYVIRGGDIFYGSSPWTVIGVSQTAELTFDLSSGAGVDGYGFAISTDTSSPFTSIHASVPEPTTIALLGAGLIGLGAVARRNKKAV